MVSYFSRLFAVVCVAAMVCRPGIVTSAQCLLSTSTHERLPFRVVHKLSDPRTPPNSDPDLHVELSGQLLRHADGENGDAASAYTIEIVQWNVVSLNKEVLTGGPLTAKAQCTAPLTAPVRARLVWSDGVWRMPPFEELNVDSLPYLKKGQVVGALYAVISATTFEFDPAATGKTLWKWRVGIEKWGLRFPIGLDARIARPDALWEFRKRRDEGDRVVASCAVTYPYNPNDAQLYLLAKIHVLASYPSGTIHRVRLESGVDDLRDRRMLDYGPFGPRAGETPDPPLVENIWRRGGEWFDVQTYQHRGSYDIIFDYDGDASVARGETTPESEQ